MSFVMMYNMRFILSNPSDVTTLEWQVEQLGAAIWEPATFHDVPKLFHAGQIYPLKTNIGDEFIEHLFYLDVILDKLMDASQNGRSENDLV